MRKTIYLLHILTSIAIRSSCGGEKKEGNDLASKKAALEKLKTEQNALAEKIVVLQNEINVLDTANAGANAKLINITPVAKENFVHYIDLQGNITSDNISYVSPRMGGGQVRAIYVKRGDIVSKAVSYTHLDVYKRQHKCKPIKKLLHLHYQPFQVALVHSIYPM